MGSSDFVDYRRDGERQAKGAAYITMHIMGQHHVLSRLDELLDEFPQLRRPAPD